MFNHMVFRKRRAGTFLPLAASRGRARRVTEPGEQETMPDIRIVLLTAAVAILAGLGLIASALADPGVAAIAPILPGR
jgi:hypothetical protein